MSETVQNVRQTPGPITVFGEMYPGLDAKNGQPLVFYGHDKGVPLRGVRAGDGESPQLNARLLAAAYTSHDHHFGEQAVNAAEGDVLGRLLSVCELLFEADQTDNADAMSQATTEAARIIGEYCPKVESYVLAKVKP